MPLTSSVESGPDPNILSSMVKLPKSDKSKPLSSQPHQETLLHHFKLISVNFKEAALDSPSFRASMNHLDLQINTIEQWLTALASSFKKIPKYLKEVQSYSNSFLEHLVPTFIQDGIIDQEYTVTGLNTTLDGLKTVWGLSIQALSVDAKNLKSIELFKRHHVIKYKETRKRYEDYQAKYDKYLSIYLSSSKSKDPLMVIEDAKQLYQVRKEYIHASLDLVIEIQNLSKNLNKLLVGVNTDLWRNKWNIFGSRGVGDAIKEEWDKIQRIQSWNDSYTLAIEKLNSDMLAARNQVEEGCHIQFQPSTNVNDYKSTIINNRTLRDIDEPGVEKHGYLFMKTWTEKSSKPIWVHRWAFIKNGVFGLLVVSPSQTFVQETDKIGILLCNVRYAPNEDRRFCFEIRTNDFTAVFQAESLVELKSWLKVFENEKFRISGPEALSNGLFNIASGRFPPIISEFSSTVDTVIDQQLTNAKVTLAGGQIVAASSLSNHLERFEDFFKKYMYFEIPKICPPFMTDTTKSSIMAYCLTSPTQIPNALTANIWGSVNWGLYYLHDTARDSSTYLTGKDAEMIKFQEEHFENDKFYPDFYPKEYVNLDIQMRALFETAVEPGEYCVLSYSCIWSPNSKQELSGRCFVTNYHMYFYMQALGFVALFKGFLGHLVSVEFVSQKNYDLMKVYNIDGVIKMKVFLDDAICIKKKLVYLINNIVSDKPKSLEGVLADFSDIEKEIAVEKSDQKNLREISQLSKGLSSKSLASEKLLLSGETSSILPGKSGRMIKHRVNFTPDYNLISDRTYPAPPKAIFHALLGDNSVVFRSQLSFASTKYFLQKPWATSSKGTLYRDFNVPAMYDGKDCFVQVRQEIDNMEDNTYYTFTHEMSKFELLLGSPYKTVFKIVIVEHISKRSKVFVYSKTYFDRLSVWNPLVIRLNNQVDVNKVRKLEKSISEAVKEIGTHGMIVRAIYLYGKLSHTSKPEAVTSTSVIKFGIVSLFKLGLGKAFSKAYSFAVKSFIKPFQLVVLLLKSLRMNVFLVFIIVLLSFLNLFLAGKTATSYWNTRSASKLAQEYVTKEPRMLQRSIYLKDLESILNENISIAESRPFSLFKQNSFIFNLDADSDWSNYFGSNARDVARLLKSSFQDIGIKRHELLVKLKILKSMEEEIIQAEWQNWLMSEAQKCDYVMDNVVGQIDEVDNYQEGVDNIIEYCHECKKILANLV